MDELAILSGVEDLSRVSAVEEPLAGEVLCVTGGFFCVDKGRRNCFSFRVPIACTNLS